MKENSSNLQSNGDIEALQRVVLVEWLNSLLPNLNLPTKASNEELRACLIDGAVLCRILNRLKPGLLDEVGYSGGSITSRPENVKRFLAAMDRLGIPRFEITELEKGSMKIVTDCLLTLREQFTTNNAKDNFPITSSRTKPRSPSENAFSWDQNPLSGEERHKIMSESKFQRSLGSPVMSEPSGTLVHHVGHKFHEVFQLKQGSYADLPAAKISEMMKSNSLDNAPTQSLLSVVNGILDESVERKNGEIPYRFACLLRKVVQEIELRISTQAEHLRTQNNLFKAREEKYQSRIRVLEALAAGAGEESQIAMNQLQQAKAEKSQLEEKKKLEEELAKLMKEKDRSNLEISALKQELEIAKKNNNLKISALKQELEMTKKKYELNCMQVETEAKDSRADLEERLKEHEQLLADSRNKIKELEAYSESKCQGWNKKEHAYKNFMDFQFGAVRELRLSFQSIKQEVLRTQKSYSEEFKAVGLKLKALADAAENYHIVLAENRKMFNELQELKGNIRVYCRIRPFLPGETAKQATIEYIGEHGELVTANPSKQGKDGRRNFKFNKVFGPAATQAEVYSDTQPLIRCVLDGYNVCIFAYGQTGSGKTFTMSGPNGATEETWGVNYRALNDLFQTSQNRRSFIKYEVAIQMVEIYNEQVRDLLSSDGAPKKLGILTTSRPNGLAVPDATMHPVRSTADILELMDIGLKSRAVGATALNERSSRSHSVVTIHVRGTDLKTGASLLGNLHLVDLAGSERVDRSEATGDRLKEAQHINKSLSALGDVIFALAQKNPHIPYRNSKLTQLLQSSLGGQAKTLMFVQLNPDVNSYSETLSTLKFAERVSGVELGAARSSKEGRDVRELMEQVASLKDTIARKDDEIERLHLLKDLKNVYSIGDGEKRGTGAISYGSSPPSRENDKLSEADSQFSTDPNEFGDAESEERFSDDVSDGGLSAGTEADGSASENVRSPEAKRPNNLQRPKSASKVSHLPQKSGHLSSTPSKVPLTIKKSGSSSTLLRPPRPWQ